jgi:hypothetical protein
MEVKRKEKYNYTLQMKSTMAETLKSQNHQLPRDQIKKRHQN